MQENGSEQPVLEVEGVAVRYGGVVALDGVTLSVAPGEMLAVIGPNGAGKTTLCDCVSGIRNPTEGSIAFNGETLSRLPAHRRTRLGIARTFQTATLFNSLSVFDNVLVGAEGSRRGDARRTARDALECLRLQQYANRSPAELSTGYRKRVEMARAFAAQPTLMLLDEPMAGVSAEEAEATIDILAGMRADNGLAIILVEHNLCLVLAHADRVAVLDRGSVISVGAPAEVKADAAVREVYLGQAP